MTIRAEVLDMLSEHPEWRGPLLAMLDAGASGFYESAPQELLDECVRRGILQILTEVTDQ